jgi:hypothetical protein
MVTGDAIWLGILVAIACTLTYLVFRIKNPIFSILAGTLWAVLGVNRISASANRNYSDFNYTIGVFFLVVAIASITTIFWAFKKSKGETPVIEEEDYWTRKEKRVAQLRKRRPHVIRRKREIDDWAKDV